jgi:hypothetical protein
MTDQSLARLLLPALDITAFERTPDGSFTPLTPPPPWFQRLADVTFPFLGHILDEANQFWASGEPGSREWGPCAEVDAAGAEFHYKVTAITATGQQYLLFQRDRGADRMREALQTIRDQKLAMEQGGRTLAMARDARRAADQIRDVVAEQLRTAGKRAPAEWLSTLSIRSADLVQQLDELSRALRQKGF